MSSNTSTKLNGSIQPKPPEESDETISLSFFVVITGVFVILIILKMLLH